MRRKEREKKRTLPGSLIKQLTAYSAAAGVVLLMSPKAESAIHVFHPAEPLIINLRGHFLGMRDDNIRKRPLQEKVFSYEFLTYTDIHDL